jgi:serine palmitoyltransferase
MGKGEEEYLQGHKKDWKIDDIHSVLSYVQIILIYIAYTVIFSFAAFREGLNQLFITFGIKKLAQDKYLIRAPKGYAPLLNRLEGIYLHRVYQRISDGFQRPVASAPGPWFTILERESDDENFSWKITGKKSECLNLGSYNYLGFAENNGPITELVAESIRTYGVAMGAPRMEGGDSSVVRELEKLTAQFIGKEDALIIGMGFATNSTTIPAFCGGKGTLIISDSLNHNSIVNGSRDSAARILVFKHNDMRDLDNLLRNAIVEGQPRTRRPWKKIVIIVEGIYSMEGEVCNLPAIVALKKKYKAYLYVDEAHSIGALGKTGRGICEHWGVDPADVDILMGTYTKAFGSVGGYIAGPKAFVDFLRSQSYGSVYSAAMSPPCAQQALSALRVIMGLDGTNEGAQRIQRLHDNSNYFRDRLRELGFFVFGDTDSPIIPMMLYHVSLLPFMSRYLLLRQIAVVIVGFPVTPMLLNRVRFCISASHKKEDLEWAIKQIEICSGYFTDYKRKKLN